MPGRVLAFRGMSPIDEDTRQHAGPRASHPMPTLGFEPWTSGSLEAFEAFR